VCGLWAWIQKVKDVFAGKEKEPLVILPESVRIALSEK
jgi:hypothetical protein